MNDKLKELLSKLPAQPEIDCHTCLIEQSDEQVKQMPRHTCGKNGPNDDYKQQVKTNIVAQRDKALDERDNARIGVKSLQRERDEAVELLDECRLQLEYLNANFTATGTTNNVLARVKTFLDKINQSK